MKESRFNIVGEYDERQVWVYNTMTTATVILTTSEYNRFFHSHMTDGNDETFLQLCEMGYFIDDDFDEFTYLRNLRDTVVKSNSQIADIMIAPTMDCNARCYYCFEHGCHHDKMSISTADAVVKYIKENWNHDLFNINWFGGEPLMATDIIDYISEQLEESKVKFVSRITTNGYYLTPDVAMRAMEKWHTHKIQISIDALYDEYNNIKRYINTDCDDPFERVIHNLEEALEVGLTVRVRINFNPLKKDKASQLMEFLQNRFGKYSGFSSYFAPIDADSKIVPTVAGQFENEYEHPYLSLIHFSQQYGYFSGNNRGVDENFLYDEKGLLTSLKLYPSPTNCYASCPCVFAIDSRGDLYKCHRVLGRGSRYSSGNVSTGIVRNDIYEFFCNSDLPYKECETCKILPICQGGCKINAYIYHDEHACAPIKNIVSDLIKMYIDKIY